MSISKLIWFRIESLPKGQPFNTRELLTYGSRAVVDQTLARLTRQGKILRLARGIYTRPKYNKYVGNVMPEPLKIAEAKARTSNAMLGPTGAEAARMFGLTTQMPTQPVYFTTGSPTSIHFGKLTIKLVRASARKIQLSSTRVGLAISALWFLGKEETTHKAIAKIERQLSPDEFAQIKQLNAYMPGWLSNKLYSFQRKKLIA
jgi:hypothetical protein